MKYEIGSRYNENDKKTNVILSTVMKYEFGSRYKTNDKKTQMKFNFRNDISNWVLV